MLKSLWIVLALVVLGGSSVAKADTTQTVDFTVNVNTGTESGDMFTGSYSFDATTLAMTGTAPLTAFTFTDPAFAGDSLSTTGFSPSGHEVLSTATGLLVFFAPSGGGTDDAFIIEGPIGGFIYGTTSVVGLSIVDLGFGTFTPSIPAPEPSSVALMLLGVGLLFVLRKRNPRGHQLAA